MNVLLIGGTGVLSSAVTSEALKQGIEVTMINRGRRNLPQGVEVIKSDMTNYDFIASQLKNRHFDAIIDFLCYTDEATTKSFNLYSQFTNQYFFISSCAVYNTEVGGIMEEDSPKVLSVWKYSVNKWASEQHLQQLASHSKCKYTIIRPAVTYGDTRIPYGISPQYGYHWTLCARILADKPIIRWNGGVNRCNMTRVEDFAVGVVGLIGNPKAYNQAFNVCGDEMPSFNDVLNVLEKCLNHKVKVVDVTSEFYAKELPSRAGEILGGRSIDALNSNTKIKTAVPSFNQTLSLEEGIKKTIDAYKSQNYQYGIDWLFDAETDRIIKKWYKFKDLQPKDSCIKFIDYLSNATASDRRLYKMTLNKELPPYKILIFTLRVVNFINRQVKHIF